MTTNQRRATWLTGAAAAALCFCGAASAQELITTQPEPTMASEVVVPGTIAYRNRSEQAAPVLDYDQDYFQRFEPLTAGDALKRVPSVTFLSDVLESDGARLRGLDPGYTQVLINGEHVPGSGVDRSFFVDRIPAELIERVEIIRSASANRSGDAMAGALNIVLRDAYSLDGGFLRAGALRFNDGRVRETLGAVWGGQVGPGRLLLGANVQGRRNPKEKHSLRYDEPPANAANFSNREDQTDLRNGTDYSFNASYTTPLAGGELDLGAFYVKTDRRQSEHSLEYPSLTGFTGLETENTQIVDIDQENLTLTGRYDREMLGGKTALKLSFSGFKEKDVDTEEQTDFTERPAEFEGDRILTDIDDKEIAIKLEHKRPVGAAQLEFGLQYQKKTRDTRIVEDSVSADLPARPRAYGRFEDVLGGVNDIEETRVDPYVMLSGKAGAISWETGLRYETTDVDILDKTVAPALASRSLNYDFALPSLHLRWAASANDRFSLSFARTVRRPGFDQISPALLEAELGENDLLGNPDLKPETAWGVDLGYERRLGRRGVVGINFFYRGVTDLIETASTGRVGSEGAGTFVLQPRNTGDGHVQGVEFDMSTPLTAIGLKDTGVFFNYSWLDSKVSDDFGGRKFNSQSGFVFNIGFIQDLPSLGAAFGATYRKQGKAFGRIVGEEVTTEYGGDLEMFLEKRIGKKVTIRFTGSNLLNMKKDETFNKFDTLSDQRARNFDEYELESEEAGAVYQLIARVAF